MDGNRSQAPSIGTLLHSHRYHHSRNLQPSAELIRRNEHKPSESKHLSLSCPNIHTKKLGLFIAALILGKQQFPEQKCGLFRLARPVAAINDTTSRWADRALSDVSSQLPNKHREHTFNLGSLLRRLFIIIGMDQFQIPSQKKLILQLTCRAVDIITKSLSVAKKPSLRNCFFDVIQMKAAMDSSTAPLTISTLYALALSGLAPVTAAAAASAASALSSFLPTRTCSAVSARHG